MSEQPNIIMVLVDDMGAWGMGCAGNPDIRTPNLDALAASGMRFGNCFCASPVCSPARATLLTGRMPSQHGVHDWIRAGDTVARYEPERGGERIEYLRGQTGYTDVLAAAGYECGLSGKWHLGDSHQPQKGFEFWHVHAKGGGPYHGAPMVEDGRLYEEPDYVTDAIARNAINWLEGRRDITRPFYLGVHFTAPHSPWERGHHPAELFDDYYQSCEFASIPWNERAPDWVRFRSIPVDDDEKRRTFLSGYAAATTAMDAAVGRLLAWLDAHGLRERTLILFTGDNGMNMGHHGLFGKGNATYPLNFFDTSVRVPFIASHPGRIPSGRVDDGLVGHVDFFQTLLEYAGLPVPDFDVPLPGRSFLGRLTGEVQPPSAEDDAVMVCDEYGAARMIRTGRWKWVERLIEGPDELYDLTVDPDERENLASCAEWAAVARDLHQRLEAWFDAYSTPEHDGRAAPVTGAGQLQRWDAQAGNASAFAPLPGGERP